MIKMPSTSQSSVSAFNNRVALLYFDILTRKTTEMDFDGFILNVDIYVSFKIVQESPQSNVCISR